MRNIALTLLLLLVFGITLAGCGTILDTKMRRGSDIETPTEQYIGPQTVEAVMTAFDERYTARASNAKWAAAKTTSDEKKHHIEFALADMDAKYPREEWLQMLLNKGITIENFKNYDGYFNIRSALILKEFYSEDDWETVKVGYIDSEIQKYQRKHQLTTEAKQAIPDVKDWIVIGENALPNIPGRIYLQKTESGYQFHRTSATIRSENGEIISAKGPKLSKQQESDLVHKGVEPEGWEVVYLDEKGNPIRLNE